MEHRLETLEILKSSRKTAFDHYLGMITGYQKLVWSRSAGAPCFKDQVRQAKADFSLVLRAPGKTAWLLHYRPRELTQ